MSTEQHPPPFTNIAIGDILTEDRIITELDANNRWQAIDEMLERLIEIGAIKRDHQNGISNSICKREQSMSTGIGFGIAIPHAITDLISEAMAALGRSKKGIAFDALDGQPVSLVMLFLVPQGQFQKHLHTVAEIARLLHKAELRRALEQAPDAATMLRIIRDEVRR